MKIGILGCGQAGSRIALALNSIAPDVTLIVGEPNPISKIFDPKSQFYVNFASKHTDDDHFFKNEFDALVVSPDPISLFDRIGVEFKQDKMPFISEINKKTPTLVERPLGLNIEDPSLFESFTGLENASVMAYHFRLPFSKFLADFQAKRILIDASLNCGLVQKSWRQDFEKMPLPLHFGDQFLSTIGRVVGDLHVASATHDLMVMDQVKFDTNWNIQLTSEKIPTISLHLDQYAGDLEYRLCDDIIRGFGSDFSAKISVSSFEVHMADGTSIEYRYDLSTANPDHAAGIAKLKTYMTEIEGYPDAVETEGLSRAIFESVLDWYNSATGRPVICSDAFECMSIEHAKHSMLLAVEVVGKSRV